MMKKQGFTLAEVLITLTIIGVIATMTLPALMTNTQEQQAKTGIKKGINTLTEAAQLNQAIDGFAYNNLTSTENTEGIQSLYHILKSKTNVDTGKSVTNSKITVNGYTVTIVFTSPVNSLEFTLSSGQTRVHSIEVYGN